MKTKLLIFSLISLVSLSACGIKKTINNANEVVQKEQKENENNASQEQLDEESLANSMTFNINTESYAKQQEDKEDSVTYSKEKNGEFTEYIIQYAKGDVIETLSSMNSNQPISYSVEVANQTKKTNNKISNADLGINLISNFLLDTKIIEKPLNLSIELDISKRNEYKLTEHVTLTVSPQPDEDGFILQLAKNK